MAPQPTETDVPRPAACRRCSPRPPRWGRSGRSPRWRMARAWVPRPSAPCGPASAPPSSPPLVLAHRQPSVSLASLPSPAAGDPRAGRGRERRDEPRPVLRLRGDGRGAGDGRVLPVPGADGADLRGPGPRAADARAGPRARDRVRGPRARAGQPARAGRPRHGRRHRPRRHRRDLPRGVPGGRSAAASTTCPASRPRRWCSPAAWSSRGRPRSSSAGRAWPGDGSRPRGLGGDPVRGDAGRAAQGLGDRRRPPDRQHPGGRSPCSWSRSWRWSSRPSSSTSGSTVYELAGGAAILVAVVLAQRPPRGRPPAHGGGGDAVIAASGRGRLCRQTAGS